MLAELAIDLGLNNLHLRSLISDSPHTGIDLMVIAVRDNDDAWLAEELMAQPLIHKQRGFGRGNKRAAVEILAETLFNRYYCRAVCQRAISTRGLSAQVRVYQGREVEGRPQVLRCSGKRLTAYMMLDGLRARDSLEDALGLPGGEGSGLTVELVDAADVSDVSEVGDQN